MSKGLFLIVLIPRQLNHLEAHQCDTGAPCLTCSPTPNEGGGIVLLLSLRSFQRFVLLVTS